MRKLVSDISLAGAASVLSGIKGLLTLPLVTRTLGVGGFGIWATLLVTTTLLTALALLGLTGAIARFLAPEQNKERLREGFYSALCTVMLAGSLLALLLISLAGLFADHLLGGGGAAAKLVMLASILIPLDAGITMGLHYYRARLRMTSYFWGAAAQSLSELLVVLLLWMFGWGLWQLIAGYAVVKSLLFLALMILIARDIGVQIPRFTEISKYLRYCLPFLPTSFFSWMVHMSDRYLIGLYLGMTAVGVYSAAYTLSTAIVLLSSAISFVLVPTLSKLFDEGALDDVRKYVSYAFKYFLLLATPIAVLFGVFALPLLNMLTTSEIAESGGPLIGGIMAAYLLFGLGSFCDSALAVLKRTKILVLIGGLGGFSNFFLNLLLIPHYRLVGAVVATGLSFGLQLVVALVLLLRSLRLQLDYLAWGKIVVAATIMALVMVLAPKPGVGALVASAFLGCTTYLVVLVGLRTLMAREWQALRSLL